jgi:hypothetical protein
MSNEYYRGLGFKVRGKKKAYSYDKFVPGIVVGQPSPTPTPTPTPTP